MWGFQRTLLTLGFSLACVAMENDGGYVEGVVCHVAIAGDYVRLRSILESPV